MVVRAEPLIAPFLTATAGRHALVAAARAVVRGGGERGGTGAGATPGGSAGAWGLPGPGPGPQLSSDEPDSRGGWSLPTLPRASSASSLSCRPLTTLVSDLVSALAMSRSFCARAATVEMRAISLLPVSTSSSSNWTLLRR